MKVNVIFKFLILIVYVLIIAGCTPQEILFVGKEIVKEEVKTQQEIRKRYNNALETDVEGEIELSLNNFVKPLLNNIFGGAKLVEIKYEEIYELGIENCVPVLKYILPRFVVIEDIKRLRKEVENKNFITIKEFSQNGNLGLIFGKNGNIYWGIISAYNSQEILVGGSLDGRYIEVLFSDDFESYGLGQEAPFGPWNKIIGANIEQHVEMSNRIGKVLKCNRGTIRPGVFVDKSWDNYAFQVEAKAEEGRIYFRLTKRAEAGYYLQFGWVNDVLLCKFAGESSQVIARVRRNFDYGSWNLFLIRVIGDRIRVYVNGFKIIDVIDKDPLLRSGGIGFNGWIWSYFNNVRVYKF